MKKRLIIGVSVFLTAMILLAIFHSKPGNAGNSGNSESGIYAEQALNVFKSLESGNNQKAMKDFVAGDMRPDLTPGQLGLQWSHLERVWGPCKRYYITHAEDQYEYRDVAYVVYMTLEFEKRTLYAAVNFGPQKKISRLNIRTSPGR